MFHIVIHCKPKKENLEYYGKVIGAYASILIDYKDYDGAIELAKFYVIDNDWEIINIDDEYYTFESEEDLGDDYKKCFIDIEKYGYSILFNLYNEIEG